MTGLLTLLQTTEQKKMKVLGKGQSGEAQKMGRTGLFTGQAGRMFGISRQGQVRQAGCSSELNSTNLLSRFCQLLGRQGKDDVIAGSPR